MQSKVGKVKDRGYIQSGYVKSFIRYFSVPKGDQDVRMVYGGTASGFNAIVWVSKFGLTSVKTLLCGNFPASWKEDLDIGEMFLNFMLYLDAQKYVGVDVTNLFLEDMSDNQRVFWIHWYRCVLGLKPSPNHTT